MVMMVILCVVVNGLTVVLVLVVVVVGLFCFVFVVKCIAVPIDNILSSVLWHCQFDGRKVVQPVEGPTLRRSSQQFTIDEPELQSLQSSGWLNKMRNYVSISCVQWRSQENPSGGA